jgi:hypothetical protein
MQINFTPQTKRNENRKKLHRKNKNPLYLSQILVDSGQGDASASFYKSFGSPKKVKNNLK